MSCESIRFTSSGKNCCYYRIGYWNLLLKQATSRSLEVDRTIYEHIDLCVDWAPTSNGTLRIFADYMTSGCYVARGRNYNKGCYNLGATEASRKNGEIIFNYSGGTNDAKGLSSADWQNLWIEAFKYVSATLGIPFSEDLSANADIELTDNGSGAFSQSSGFISRGILFKDSSRINIPTSWSGSNPSSFGDYAWQAVVHELGHSSGLGHPGDYNGTVDWDNEVEFKNNSWAMTIVSYINQSANENISFSKSYISTFSAANVLALDDLYASRGFRAPQAFAEDTIDDSTL